MRFLAVATVVILICRLAFPTTDVLRCVEGLRSFAETPVTIESAVLKGWTPKDYQNNVGRQFFAKAEGAESRHSPNQFLDFAVGAQTLFSIAKLPPKEQDLVEKLYVMARLPKNVGTHNAREFEKQVQDWLDTVRRNHIDLSEQEIRARAREQTGAHEIEAGVWLIKLKSGKSVAAFHTSRQENTVDTGAAAKAFNGLMSKVKKDDIVSIQYFHNHPATAPLSRGDEVWLNEMKHQLGAQGLEVPLEMYSVFESGGQRFAFGMEPK